MDKYNDIKKKSTDTQILRVSKKGIKRLIATSFITGAILTYSLSSAVGAYKEKLDLLYSHDDQLSIYGELVRSETKRTENGEHFYYDIADIASKIVEDPEKYHIALYGVFKNIGWNEGSAINQMDEVVRVSGLYIKSFNLDLPIYSSFKEYLTDRGFANPDGTLDLIRYRATLNGYMDAIKDLEKFEKERGK